MGSNVLFTEYFREINNLVDILTKYISSYRLLIGGAGELNSIALARRSDVKDALRRVNELGKLIDCLMKTLECAQGSYIDYIKLKGTLLEVQATKDIIITEIENELLLNNSRCLTNECHDDKPHGDKGHTSKSHGKKSDGHGEHKK